MKIIGVRTADKRRDRRIHSIPIQIKLKGRTYDTRDWSLGGILIAGYRGSCLPGEEVTVGISVTVNGHTSEYVARAEVVRVAAATGYLAAAFTELDAHTIDMLEGLMTGRFRRRRFRVG